MTIRRSVGGGQDEILKRMEDGELELDGISAQTFFDLVLTMPSRGSSAIEPSQPI
ncbi:MAG TPA: hypothetical protein VHG11_03475 [Pseudorhizobium sp.]|nr:hypothetical protein [Pseudorhizobium sp.]